jgi:hypothetical protein
VPAASGIPYRAAMGVARKLSEPVAVAHQCATSASFAQQISGQRVEPLAPVEHAPLPVEWDQSKQ